MVWEIQCFEDIFSKGEEVSELMNDNAVFRTAPAKPGLSINVVSLFLSHNKSGSFRVSRGK